MTTEETRKKVVLISLPAPFASEPAMNPPLGLCYIAAVLRQADIADIRAVDFTLYKEYDYFERADYLEKIPTDADVYGIYCMSVQFQWLAQATAYIKRRNPKALVVAGGPHASTCPEECLRRAGVDIAINGEGEYAFTAVVEGKDLTAINGACYLDKAGRFVGSERAFVADLDALPFPDRDLFSIREYKRQIDGEKAVHIVTLRGCPYKCAFCDKKSVGTNVRYRSVANVMREIDFVRDRYGWNAVVIYDDIFTLKRERVYSFCDEFAARKLKWRCWSRTNTIDVPMLKRMKEAGLVSITFGVESGDSSVLKKINKETTREMNLKALLACKELHVPVRCSIMYGNPGESLESVRNTISLIAEAQPDEWNLAVLAPIPGSDIWEHPEKYGVVFDKEWVRAHNYTMTNRFDSSGIGSVWISLAGQGTDEFAANLKYLVEQLERVCPRKRIQDTIQAIDMDKLHIERKQ